MDGPKAWMSVDDARMHDPMLCMRYAFKQNIHLKPGWEWIGPYIASDENLVRMVHAYKAATARGAARYKFRY